MGKLRLILWGAVGVALLAAGYLFIQQKEAGYRAGGGGQPQISLGGPFTLMSHTGETVSYADYEGHYKLIYFGYTYCPDVCPLELQKMSAALINLEQQGVSTDRIQPLFISVDPERDTPEELARYVPAFHDRLVGLTGSLEEVRSVAKSFRIYFGKRGDEGDGQYLMDHTSLIFLMKPNGDFLRFFDSQDTPATIEQALKPILAG